jgi:hypothetical protein
MVMYTLVSSWGVQAMYLSKVSKPVYGTAWGSQCSETFEPVLRAQPWLYTNPSNPHASSHLIVIASPPNTPHLIPLSHPISHRQLRTRIKWQDEASSTCKRITVGAAKAQGGADQTWALTKATTWLSDAEIAETGVDQAFHGVHKAYGQADEEAMGADEAKRGGQEQDGAESRPESMGLVCTEATVKDEPWAEDGGEAETGLLDSVRTRERQGGARKRAGATITGPDGQKQQTWPSGLQCIALTMSLGLLAGSIVGMVLSRDLVVCPLPEVGNSTRYCLETGFPSLLGGERCTVACLTNFRAVGEIWCAEDGIVREMQRCVPIPRAGESGEL